MIDVIKTPLEEIFGYNTKQSELKEVCKYITNTFNKENGYSSIPKPYYSFLYKLLSYRKFDSRGEYKNGDIRTFYVGRDEYGNYSIAFFDIEGKHDFIGCTSAIKQWQNEKNDEWEHMKDCVLGILRNLARFRIKEKRDKIILPVKCEISGQLIENIDDLHIDHYDDDFSKVAFNWMLDCKHAQEKYRHRRIDIIKEMYDMHDEDFKYFKDKIWNRSFIDYHDSHTHLRVVSKKSNLQREKYRPNWDLLKINGCYIEKYEKEKKFNK